MGIERRLIVVTALAGGLIVSASACSEEPDVLQRRQLLAADARGKARQERINDKRVLSPDGELLPSETKVAGIVLPRGFSQRFAEEHAWTYDSDLPQAKVREFLERRLTMTSVENRPLGEVMYVGVREKAKPEMTPVVVKVMPVPNRPNGSRIYVGEPQPPRIEQTEDQARSSIAAQRTIAR
jgi:hypothetical protein